MTRHCYSHYQNPAWEIAKTNRQVKNRIHLFILLTAYAHINVHQCLFGKSIQAHTARLGRGTSSYLLVLEHYTCIGFILEFLHQI